MRTNLRAVGIPVVVAIVLAGLIIVIQSRRDAEQAEEAREDPPTWVETKLVAEQDGYEVETAFLGEAEAARGSRLGFELPGTLNQVRVDQGTEVAAGEVLARLDTQRLESQLTELRAALREAEASQRLAEANFERVSGLVESKVATPQELDEVRQSRDAAAATVARVEAQIDSVQIDLEKSVIRAPFAGTIAQRFLDEGSIVAAGRHVVELLETDRLEIRAGVPPANAHLLNPGDEVSIRMRSGETVVGNILRVAPQRGSQTRTIDILVDAANAPVVDGDLAEVVLNEKRKEPGYWLPIAALTESARGLWACYVAEPEGDRRRAERRQVEILHEEEDRVYVRGALETGDEVVVNGIQRLTPGLTVKITDPAGDKTASNP